MKILNQFSALTFYVGLAILTGFLFSIASAYGLGFCRSCSSTLTVSDCTGTVQGVVMLGGGVPEDCNLDGRSLLVCESGIINFSFLCTETEPCQGHTVSGSLCNQLDGPKGCARREN